MFRFVTKHLVSNHHNVYKTQESSINLVNFLQTLALESKSSDTCDSKIQQNPTVSYLVGKCGLPLHSAISASKEFSIKNTQKADSVLQLFNSYGFTQTQITSILTKCPSLVRSNSVKTLEPKLEFFESLGLSKPDLAKILSSDRNILKYSLRNIIIPTVDFLKTIVNTNEGLLRTLKQWPSIIRADSRINMEPNVLTLRAHGVPDLNICNFLVGYPRSFMVRNGVFQDKVTRVEKLGAGPESLAYLRSLRIMLSLSDSLWEKKVNIFKSFGWSDEDILAAFKKQPNFIGCSEKKVRLLMDFYLNKLGFKPSDVAKCPNLLTLSFEKRIIPRCLVLHVLLSKGLIIELNLASALIMIKAQFEKMFLTKYQEVAPEIVSVYQGKEKDFPRFEAMDVILLGLYTTRRSQKVQEVLGEGSKNDRVLKVISSSDL